LLDLNMPRKDGRELLAEIKADPNLRAIPVVILTTSDAEDDIARLYEMQANCFLNKPFDLGQYTEVVQAIKQFWLTLVKLPRT
jgi:CheY-like chemotaxis protein